MSAGWLETLFNPRSIAVIGASARPDAIGTRVIRNLQKAGYPGSIYPINPRYDEVAGLPCAASVEDLPDGVEAAFIAIPAESVVAALDTVGRRGTRAVFVNASGFADAGPSGRELQDELAAMARRHGVALCGPNNMGLINVHDRAAIWTQRNAPAIAPGPVAVIAQSGSITLVLAEDERELGLSYLVTAGNEAVLGVADYLAHIVEDERVRTILLFVESIRDPKRFGLAADRASALGKRILAVKTGTSERGRSLVAAHTDSLAGDDSVYDAFFRRHGVVRVHDLDEMIETAVLVTAYPRPPATTHVVPVTLSGGEAALIADVSARVGLRLAPLSAATVTALAPAFPSFARPQNPLDGWGLGFNEANFGIILDALQADPFVGAVALSIDAPASGGGDTPYALAMTRLLERPTHTKPVIVFNNTVGTGPNRELKRALDPLGIPYLTGMRNALAAISSWLAFGAVPPPSESRSAEPLTSEIRAGLDDHLLTETALFEVLRRAGLPMVACAAAATPEEAAAIAERFELPVVVKGGAAEIPHKTEHGLVRMPLGDTEAVRRAHQDLSAILAEAAPHSATREIVVQPLIRGGVELVIAVRTDPDFGPVVIVGLGGLLVEFIRSAAVRLGPVDRATARSMLDECRASELLAGFRGNPACDAEAAISAIVALSRLSAGAGSRIASIEINPMIVRPDGAFGVDVLLTRSA